ncbi:hypothetical protein BABINDRAFT_163057 [Babjeviella inositovora NRRL Y-12698]|uniref:AAA+ ATPase domain-containing protein n=1 Tax=Babjeviella inositovora NRRL Y-12698 TaxID=984486 RepID=A0A1E3QJZ8_9ASCO|nr:uncharacterized protein BABINDRAFT_163057 [Babjeviella inositovora NRRL Y-12698]ODQ78016.1 hypothetical protein BABINDRAFT_163057 [Babjeviella inositovora NRRL Y-12698]
MFALRRRGAASLLQAKTLPTFQAVTRPTFAQAFVSSAYRAQRQYSTQEEDNKDRKDKDEKKTPPTMQEYMRLPEFRNSLIISAVAAFLFAFNNRPTEENLFTFQDFKVRYLEKGLVSSITVDNNSHVRAELLPGTNGPHGGFPVCHFDIGSVNIFEEQLNAMQDKLGIPQSDRVPVKYTRTTPLMAYVMPFVPTVLFIGGLVYLNKKMGMMGKGGGGPGGMFSMNKSKAKLFNQETDIKVKFKDVAGCNESKEEIMEFVHFLKDPAKFERLGAKIPRGAVLSGPPGTGKTLLAKATAGEAGVPFLSVSGSEFVEMFVGVGASRVRDLFKQARSMAPSIIFIDEIDAIGKKRGGGGGMGGNDEKEATLNQILVEMDGFDTNDHVIVLAGTNRADILDPALLRPGRFDRHVYLDRPDIEGRKAIFHVHIGKLKLKVKDEPNAADVIDRLCGKLAALTPGFAGADVANCCNEAALIAARLECNSVEFKHFELAIERVIAGLEKKSKILSKEERTTVAYHEAGHAVCGWFLEYADPLLKVSIIPRGQGALGYAQYLPPDQYLVSQEQFRHKMVMALGGRVSEELHFASVTSGASDDFKKVTQMAKSMVLSYGMSPKVGEICYDTQDQQGFKINKPFSQKTGQTIDLEIKRIIDEAYSDCTLLLKEKIALVDIVAKELLAKEVITRDDMVRLLGQRPFVEKNDAFNKYIGGGLTVDESQKSAPPAPEDAPKV